MDLLARHNEAYGESTQRIGWTDVTVDLVADLTGKVEEGGHRCELAARLGAMSRGCQNEVDESMERPAAESKIKRKGAS